MGQEPQWTADEIIKFDSLIDCQESRDQMVRIEGRLSMRAFVAEHGRSKCDAMFAHLEEGGERVASSVVHRSGTDTTHQERPS